MKKSAIVLFFAAFLSITALAQNVQEGVNHLYAERYQSAKSTFDKLLATNPNNIEASYWLGQTYIAQKNVAAAKSLYEKAAAASNNAPLIVVGLGQVALLEGRGQEARQQFDAAITASRGKKGNDPAILNAVGRANVESYTEATKAGDLDYAVAKLNEAAGLSANNPDIFLNLGNAYRKKRDAGSGGLAVQSFSKARQLNSALGVAPFRAAMLYKTQVNYRNLDAWGVVLDNLNAAVTADPRFAPAYEQLYYYYLFKKDYSQAENYASKYISNSDPSVENDYLKAQTLFVQNKFPEAIAIGKNIISQSNNNAKPRVYRMLGYSYLGSKDTATACDYVNQFFAKATEDDIIGEDYILHAMSCGNHNPALVEIDIRKMLDLDSNVTKKIATLRTFSADAKASGQRVLEGTLNLLIYQLQGPNAQSAALISQVVLPFYLGGAYQKADSVSKLYMAIAPDSIYGAYWSARSLAAIDTTGEQGLAVPSYERTLEVANTDKVRYKTQGVLAAQSLAIYYNNVKGDKAKALEYVNKGLEFDPASSSLLQIKKVLDTPAPRQSAPKTTKPPAKGTTSAPAKGSSTTVKKKS